MTFLGAPVRGKPRTGAWLSSGQDIDVASGGRRSGCGRGRRRLRRCRVLMDVLVAVGQSRRLGNRVGGGRGDVHDLTPCRLIRAAGIGDPHRVLQSVVEGVDEWRASAQPIGQATGLRSRTRGRGGAAARSWGAVVPADQRSGAQRQTTALEVRSVPFEAAPGGVGEVVDPSRSTRGWYYRSWDLSVLGPLHCAAVSPIAIRRSVAVSRNRFALVFALLVLAGAVVAHHGLPMDMHSMAAGAVCLAIAATAMVAVAAVGLVLAAWRRPVSWPMPRVRPIAPRSVPARAGPALFLRLGVLRR